MKVRVIFLVLVCFTAFGISALLYSLHQGFLGARDEAWRAARGDVHDRRTSDRSTLKGLAIHVGIGNEEGVQRRLEEIAALGANSVELYLPLYMEHSYASSVYNAESIGFSPETLRFAIRQGNALGLKTFAFPFMRIEYRKPGQWRGNIKPANWLAWFKSYKREESSLSLWNRTGRSSFLSSATSD